MKNSIIIPFLLISTFAFSQGSKIAYDFQNGNSVTTDVTTNLNLPLTISFTDKFNGKSMKFLSEDGTQVIALNNSKFGEGNLSRDGASNKFYIVINADRTVNPGDEKINLSKFILQIEQVKIKLSLSSNFTTGVVTEEPKKEEKYEAGYIYYDALKLVDDKTTTQTKVEILNAYNVDLSNPDLNPYLEDIVNKTKSDAQGSGIAPFLSNLGNTDVTYFAAGLARFLAERTKEELNEAFFSKMKEQLNAYPELKTVFPKTASFLDIIETYSYASVIQVLKEAFEMDIQNLPENLYNIKGLTDGDCDKIAICNEDKVCDNYTECQARLKKLAEFFKSQDGKWIALGMFSVKEGIQSTNPAELLKSIVLSTEFTSLKTTSTANKKYDDYNIASSIELSSFISQSLISTDDKQVWVTTTQINSLFKIKDAFKIYLGLLLAKELKGDTKVEFYDSSPKLVSFSEILVDNYSTYTQFESLIKNTYSAYNATNNAVKKMISASERSVEADPHALYDYYRTLTSSLKPIVHNQLLSKFVGKDLSIAYNKVEQFLNHSVDIAYHISTKKYSAAIYDASILLTSLNNVADEKKHSVFKPITKSFVKYGTLISTVANAQSSDEVKQALNASVLPVGSYSIKRKTNWSFSINAYVGAYWSYSNSAIDKDSIPRLGLTAPVGFTISKGFSKTGNRGGLSLNLQIIDLGALVNYYLLKGDTTSIPNDFKVKLSNIFSPGFNLSYNIPKTPLSLAWGGQYIPTIYKYEQISGKNQLTPTNVWRWQLSLLVDIPLFNLKVWDFKK